MIDIKIKTKIGELQMKKYGIKEQDPFKPIVSVNWHLWPRCNYHCSFCFGHFKDINPKTLSLDRSVSILHILKGIGVQKITFTGGEPLLCPYLGDLLKEAKSLGFTTMIVSNGSLITQSFLREYHPYIDWIGLSLDSVSDEVEALLGRGYGGHIKNIRKIVPDIKGYGIKLKINVVVTRLTYKEDLTYLLTELAPDRLKFFQVLKIRGENDHAIDSLLISNEQFQEFVNRHRRLNPISESNDLMIGSYIMLDPLGRFFQNFDNKTTYSPSILDTDPLIALNTIGWDYERFLQRGGIYQW